MEKQIFVTNSVLEDRPYMDPGTYGRQDAGDVEGVGTLRWVGSKLYRWVQNRAAAALAAGDVVYHNCSNLADAEKWVSGGLAADLGFMAGVVASTKIDVGTTAPAVDYSDGGYGWIQVVGYNAAVAILPNGTTDMAAGHVCIGADATKAIVWGAALNTSPKHKKNIMLLEACASMQTPVATTKKCWISCL